VIRSSTILLGLSALIGLLSILQGCDMMNYKATDPFSQEREDLSADYSIHGLKSCDNGGWRLLVWTNATTYFP
jgi:hypothetical protein